MTPEIRAALAMWENAATYAYGNARKTPLLVAVQLIEAGDKLAELVRATESARLAAGMVVTAVPGRGPERQQIVTHVEHHLALLADLDTKESSRE